MTSKILLVNSKPRIIIGQNWARAYCTFFDGYTYCALGFSAEGALANLIAFVESSGYYWKYDYMAQKDKTLPKMRIGDPQEVF